MLDCRTQKASSPAGLLQAGMVEEEDGDGNGFSFNTTHWLQTKVPVWCDTAWADTRNYFAAIAKLQQPTLVFPSGLLSLPSPCSLHTYQYLLQREIFTALLPLLALYKGTHISFGVFERNNTHKHLPVPGHRSVCRGGQQGTEENNETPTQRHDSRAGWPGGAG